MHRLITATTDTACSPLPAWWDQLTVGGRLVVPLRLHGSGLTRAIAFDLPDHAALAQTLTHPAQPHWTGIHVRHDEPAEHLVLWLATTAGNFARLSVGPQARVSGLANPARRWAGAARYDGGTLAYLAARELTDDVNELGVIAHGPDSAKFATHTTDLLHQWDRQRPRQPTITAHRTDSPTDPSSTGARIGRPHMVITIAW